MVIIVIVSVTNITIILITIVIIINAIISLENADFAITLQIPICLECFYCFQFYYENYFLFTVRFPARLFTLYIIFVTTDNVYSDIHIFLWMCINTADKDQK